MEIVFSLILEAWKSKIKVPAWLGTGEEDLVL